MSTERRLAAVIATVAVLFLSLVYLPDVGHGFLKDDFAWVASAKRVSETPWRAFVADSTGTFFRPVVTLAFAADYLLYGLNPLVGVIDGFRWALLGASPPTVTLLESAVIACVMLVVGAGVFKRVERSFADVI